MMISSPEYDSIIDQVVYLDNWRNKRFVIWTLAIPLALFGYFVPYVHLVGLIIVFSLSNIGLIIVLFCAHIYTK